MLINKGSLFVYEKHGSNKENALFPFNCSISKSLYYTICIANFPP